jgi:hypothetical protein
MNSHISGPSACAITVQYILAGSLVVVHLASLLCVGCCVVWSLVFVARWLLVVVAGGNHFLTWSLVLLHVVSSLCTGCSMDSF